MKVVSCLQTKSSKTGANSSHFRISSSDGTAWRFVNPRLLHRFPFFGVPLEIFKLNPSSKEVALSADFITPCETFIVHIKTFVVKEYKKITNPG